MREGHRHFGFQCALFVSILGALYAGAPQAHGEASPSPESQTTPPEKNPYAEFFTEETLVVNRERDGILQGTLRTALIQASGIRAQNPFALVKITFDPSLRRVKVSKGPLPEIDGSLTTLDCQTAQGRALIEWVPPEDSSSLDPGEEKSGLKITSHGNTVRNCHITGFPGSGILLKGNRNRIEHNTLGYHSEIPEIALNISNLDAAPKSNGGAGIRLESDANENTIEYNEIFANGQAGVLFAPRSGAQNRVSYNRFARNEGSPIKVNPGNHNTPNPTLSKIESSGDHFVIEGTASPQANLQVYMLGPQTNDIKLLVVEDRDRKNNKGEHFSIVTKSKGFVAGQTQLVVLARDEKRNTSEFSAPLKITANNSAGDTTVIPPSGSNGPTKEKELKEKELEAPAPSHASPGPEDILLNEPPLQEEERNEFEENPESPTTPSDSSTNPPLGNQTGKKLSEPEEDPETIINLNPEKENRSQMDTESNKQNEVSSLGI